ncbi:MAG: hypothetical protein DWI71_04335 [Chloroflexi bacterium]|nr:MAG: hypothetical protein DWI71_04335 [Chloroflexota bacterium]
MPVSFLQADREAANIDTRNLADLRVFFLDDPSALDLPPHEVGGKVHGLARLVANGLPVPDGFVIPPAFFAPSGWSGSAEISPQVRRTIEDAYVELGRRAGQADPLVAVRSSGSLEDGTAASFAGQYATFLNVRGESPTFSASSRSAFGPCRTRASVPTVIA